MANTAEKPIMKYMRSSSSSGKISDHRNVYRAKHKAQLNANTTYGLTSFLRESLIISLTCPYLEPLCLPVITSNTYSLSVVL
ncbi:MAG: hypothetical protein ABIP28_02140, partial [Mucilaginibacter sp.]